MTNLTKYAEAVEINIHEAKAKLSHYLGLVAKGEEIIICNRNVPVARLGPVLQLKKKRRKLGLHAGEYVIPDAAFAPSTAEELKEWWGE